MKKSSAAMMLAGLLALTACGGKHDGEPGGNAAQARDDQDGALDAEADKLDAQAENLRDDGDDGSANFQSADQARPANSL